jgi:hypothetical protein
MAGAGAFIAIFILSASQTPLSGSAVKAQPGAAVHTLASAADLGSKWGIVTSLKRTPERNRAVGGAPNSFHLFGRAIDIARRPGVRHADIEAAFRKAGYVLIESLDEGDHSHFAFGLGGAAPRTITPKSSNWANGTAEKKSGCRAEAAQAESAGQSRRRPDRTEGCEPVELPAI